MKRVVMCDVCAHECKAKVPATEAVQMVDGIGLPVAVPVCRRHFVAAAKVRIRYQIAPRKPLVLPETTPAQTQEQYN